MEHILQNKKGVSMVELIAYITLYGFISSLLATLVFVIVQAARRVNAQSLLNRGATMLYTEILGQTIGLNPDTVSNVITSADGNTISISFEKRFYYTDEGERKSITENADYNTKITKITYSYTKDNDNIDVIMIQGNGTQNTTSINLDFGMSITSHDSANINNVFSVDTQNESNKYVTFHGDLHYDNKTMEFNFIVPVFTAKE